MKLGCYVVGTNALRAASNSDEPFEMSASGTVLEGSAHQHGTLLEHKSGEMMNH